MLIRIFVLISFLAMFSFSAEKVPSKKTKKNSNAKNAYENRINKMEQDIEKLQSLSEKYDAELKKTGMRSFLDEHFELGGEIELEMVDSEKESNSTVMPESDDSNPYMRLDKLRLSPFVRFTKKDAPILITMQGDIDYGGDTNQAVKIKEFFVTFEGKNNPIIDSRLKIGLEDNFMAISRITEAWPLAATAFWRKEELGFFWRSRIWDVKEMSGRWSFQASLTNGYHLDTKEAGEDSAFDMVSQSARYGAGDSALRDYGLGLGWEKRWLDLDKNNVIDRVQSNLLVFYYNDSMGSDDDTFGVNNPSLGLNTSNLDGKELFGGNASLEIGDLELVVQSLKGRAGNLKRKAGFVQGAYQIKFDNPLIAGRYITRILPLIRYGWLNVDAARNPQYPVTWDRTRWTIALITELRKRIELKTEYTINDEKTGTHDPDTNELLIQLDIKF